ncbi:MAG: hypothetical protein AAGH68_00435 [Pseudomonadota bacterium]
MPMSFCIIEPANLYYARWSGVVLPKEVIQSFDKYRNDPKFEVGRPEVVDLRAIDDLKFGTPFIMQLFSKFRTQRIPKCGVTKTIILADSALSFGRARQFQSLAFSEKRMDVQILRDEFEALAEHGISDANVRTIVERHKPEWESVEFA